jgi:hypothetical protein
MNLAELQRILVAAARANPPSDRVPHAFEKRIMARLAPRPALDTWTFWALALWRGAALCVGIMLLLSAWSFYGPTDSGVRGGDFSQDFENAVFAVVDQESDYSW